MNNHDVAFRYVNMPMVDTPDARQQMAARYQALVRQFNAAAEGTLERRIAEKLVEAQARGMRHCGFSDDELLAIAKG